MAYAILFGIEQIWYQLGVTTRSFHYAVLGIVPAMTLASFVLNRLVRRRRWSRLARIAWAGMDVALLTVLMLFSRYSAFGPLFVCYPMYIALAGLWYRARMVLMALLFSVLSYITLLVEAWLVRPEILPTFDVPFLHLTGLVVIGLIVYSIVMHIRTLSRYYGMR